MVILFRNQLDILTGETGGIIFVLGVLGSVNLAKAPSGESLRQKDKLDFYVHTSAS